MFVHLFLLNIPIGHAINSYLNNALSIHQFAVPLESLVLICNSNSYCTTFCEVYTQYNSHAYLFKTIQGVLNTHFTIQMYLDSDI